MSPIFTKGVVSIRYKNEKQNKIKEHFDSPSYRDGCFLHQFNF